jgi:hypothetical protein
MAETLSKFGVPLDGSRLGILHPKQSYRFRVLFKNFGVQGADLKELTAGVKTVTRPQISSTNDVMLHSYNSIGKIAGKHEWGDMTLTVRDDLTSAVAKHVGAQMQKQFNFFEQTSAVAGINYKFSMEVQMLDGTDNEALEAWVCEGCYLKGVEYGEHDYESSESMMISMTISIDNATHIAGPAGTVDPMVPEGVAGIDGRTFG